MSKQTITKCLALHHAQTKAREAEHKEIEATMREEFPRGTKVRWVHTYGQSMIGEDGKFKSGDPIYRTGKVVDYGYESCWITIKDGGPRHKVGAYHLEIVAKAPTNVL